MIYGYMVLITLTLVWIFFIRRAVQVNSYRMHLVRRINEICQNEIQHGSHYDNWRFQLFDQVSHWEMIFKFWKTPHSFYSRKNILKIIEKNIENIK